MPQITQLQSLPSTTLTRYISPTMSYTLLKRTKPRYLKKQPLGMTNTDARKPFRDHLDPISYGESPMLDYTHVLPFLPSQTQFNNMLLPCPHVSSLSKLTESPVLIDT